MANIKVSELSSASSFNDEDLVMIVQNNESKKISGREIIESGVNSYGHYIKYFDGTLIQYSTITYPASTPDGYTFNFPIPFIDTRYSITASNYYAYTPTVITVFSTKLESSIKIWNTYLDGETWTRDFPHDQQVEWIAIGRWK